MSDNYKNKNDYSGLNSFILKNYNNLDNRNITYVINNWVDFKDKIKEIKTLKELNEFLLLVKKNKYNTKDFDFAEEADKSGVFSDRDSLIDEEDYHEYENIYLKSQNIPLPECTNIGEIKLYDYVGHFTPRYDVRTIFISSSKYLTC